MIWRRPQNHVSDCYFCLSDTAGYNMKNKGHIKYPNVSSVSFPIEIEKPSRKNTKSSQSQSVQNEVMDVDREDSSKDSDSVDQEETSDDSDDSSFRKENTPVLFNQLRLNDFVRDLGLSKERAEVCASRLKENHMLEKGTKITYYRNRDEPFRKYFSKENSLVYCCNIEGLINELNAIYLPNEWRLFLDSSKRSFKAMLLHNGNKYASIPVAHSVVLSEEYHNLAFVLEKLKYKKHKWHICTDFKIVTIILGQQSGFTKYPCFICEWDSRDREHHYVKKHWTVRKKLIPGDKNILLPQLVDSSKIILPPLHIKLGLIKQFVKAMKIQNSNAFIYLSTKFPKLSEAKIKEGMFDGPQIRQLLKDQVFEEKMTVLEKKAWNSFRQVVTKFLGNEKDAQYEKIVEDMLINFKNLGCLMSLKVHFLHSHLDKFPENLGDFSEEQGERSHQDMKEIERCYQGFWDENMLSDYCWMLKRDTKTTHNRKSKRRSFETKK